MPFKHRDLISRIIANSIYVPETDAWIWIGNISNSGYPRLSFRENGRVVKRYVHRLIITEIHGERLRKNNIGAHIDNNKLNVNPDNIARSTQKQNIRDCVVQGRHFTPFRVERGAQD